MIRCEYVGRYKDSLSADRNGHMGNPFHGFVANMPSSRLGNGIPWTVLRNLVAAAWRNSSESCICGIY